MIRVAEPLSWHYDSEVVCAGRQLRLVTPRGGGGVETGPDREVSLSVDREVSLSGYVRALASGSACFCCGHPLQERRLGGRAVVGCSACGAEVDGPMEVRPGR